ncbi:M10 family metallopeptidase C-terminal domain-containing protein [Rhizobium sp. Root1204]|uniref:M10 family metallopeptidase C-terminal domain-containing protein n=1 Tax=Rhizobium sp. Root1204 TaxID=1736428 RepID=UPI0007158C29|nr:M10 family metallopeptidase C-terminal domain-containing protein [Rhizobium sp. Root1204]KQV31147.1 hypothetical protein ASC96_08120 [Rhizobium sp. Root1204]
MAIYFGTDFAETFAGTGGDDSIFAEGGDDIILASGGADKIDGGTGRDTLILSGRKSDYSIVTSFDSYLGSSAVLRDLRASFADGILITGDVEILQFADGIIEVDKPSQPDFPTFPELDLPPGFLALSNENISENMSVGTIVGTLSAIDPEGKALTYHLNGTGSGFAIAGDKLVTTKAFDFEKMGFFKEIIIQIEVRDPSGQSTSQPFFIKILDVVDQITGSVRGDTLRGGSGADVISGLAGNDKLLAGEGADQLIGGVGQDTLTGGIGADRFIFQSILDSKIKQMDMITDFNLAQKDKIDLSLIDANSKVQGDQSFVYLGSKAFTGKGGELRFEKAKSDTYIYGDVNGDKKADFAIQLDDAVALSKGYFIL